MVSRSQKIPVDPKDQRPDSWDRFEKAVDIALKTPAVHRVEQTQAPKPKPKKKS